MDLKIFIGFDPREPGGFAVLKESIFQTSRIQTVHALVLNYLRSRGLYVRQHRKLGDVTYDIISDAPMSTEFAISRFLVPYLTCYSGYAVFMDSDMIVLSDIMSVMDVIMRDPGKALYCVKHNHVPDNTVKMDNQEQVRYARKNWSSFMVFDCGHPANKFVTPETINTLPGRDLHRFCWLKDDEIGELPARYNYLVGHTVLPDDEKPVVVHWTDGSPELPGFKDAEYADEYFAILERWALKL